VHRVAIRGSCVGTLDELHEVVGLSREGRIPPIPLDAAPESMANRRAGPVRGRAIRKPDG
jgi:D-arabinose 1-dehydrogenase-like Zn-dependent alcohol dehydrogenase